MADRVMVYYVEVQSETVGRIVAYAEGPLEQELEVHVAVREALDNLKKQDGEVLWKDRQLLVGMTIMKDRAGDNVLTWHLPSIREHMQELGLPVIETDD